MKISEVPLSGGCHVVILGAGASIAATLRNPEAHGLQLPSMNNLPDVVGLNGVLSHFPQELIQENFEATYSNIAEHAPDSPYLKVMNDLIYSYFSSMDDRDLEQFEIIDVRSEEEVTYSWRNFIHTHHYNYCNSFFESSLALYPRRTDEAFFCHYLPITPEESFVESNPVPQDFQTIEEMWDWYQPLIDKEKSIE